MEDQIQHKINKVLQLYINSKIHISIDEAHKIAKKSPNYYESWKILALVLLKAQQYREAIDPLKKAISKNKSDFSLYFNLGVSEKNIGNFDNSIDSFKKCLELNPQNSHSYKNISDIYMVSGYYNEAISFLEKAIEIDPINAEYHNNLGIIQKKKNQHEEAIIHFQKAIENNKSYFLAHQNLASTLRDIGRYKEALDSYDKALKIKPNSSKIYREIGITNYYLRDFKESIFNLEKAFEIDPENLQALTFLFRLYLSHRELIKEYSSKMIKWYSVSQNFNTANQQNIENKNWCGESGLKILVTKAKDIGDQLLYSSMLIDLANISKSVIVECDKRLFSILKRSLPNNVFFIESRKEIISNKIYDKEIKAYQLIYFFCKDVNSFMTSQGYLKHDSNETLRFKESLKDTKKKRIIGISWKTLNKNKLAKKRNIDLEILIKSIWKDDVLLLNLQYGDVNEEIELVSEKLGIKIHQIENINNFYNLDSLASIISACNMVVTIDNTVGHLSGSLGVDTKLLLDYTPSPIWGLKENSSYIYNSIKIFRQKKPDDWSNVYSELKSELLSNLENS